MTVSNYLDLNLPMAKYVAKKYLEEVLEHISDDRLQLSGIQPMQFLAISVKLQLRTNIPP